MKFQCPKCKNVFSRDMRLTSNKKLLNKKGKYKSSCGDSGTDVWCYKVKEVGR